MLLWNFFVILSHRLTLLRRSTNRPKYEEEMCKQRSLKKKSVLRRKEREEKKEVGEKWKNNFFSAKRALLIGNNKL